jgi:Arc/MetJ family transcription regulator
MPSNLAIDDNLLAKAVRIGGHRTKRATVNEALQEYIQRRRRLRALKGFGTIEFDPTHEYRRARRKR